MQESQWGKRKKFQRPPPPKVRTGRRVADRRRRRGRGRRREELPGGAHQKRNTAIWKDGKLEKTQVRNTKEQTDWVLGSLPDANTGASWSLEYSPTNDGQYSFLPGPNSGASFCFEYSPTKRRWIFLPSFLPSPDQRVELFSPVLGGSLLFSRTWNRRGKGGKKG